MSRYKTLYILLLLFTICLAVEETQKEAEDRLDNYEKTKLKSSHSYSNEEPSFINKIASWLYPFSSSEKDDLVPQADTRNFQYLPPPPPKNAFGEPEKDCHPCNKEPWVPMASNQHQNIVPPPKVTHLDPLITSMSNYGPPKFFQTEPSRDYGFPNPSLTAFGGLTAHSETNIQDYVVPPPVNTRDHVQSFIRPNFKYVVPNKNYIPSNMYGVPSPPQKPIYGPPKPIYGPPTPVQPFKPLKPQYGPPNNNYPPQMPSYGPPMMSYGPPRPQYNGPSYQYLPQSQFNTPTTILQPVIENMRPPPISGTYGSPSNNPPQKIPPTSPSGNYGPPPAVPSDSYGAPLAPNAQDYLMVQEQLSQSTGDSFDERRPIPFPNLSSFPVAPIKEPQNFRETYSGHADDVQVLPSVQVADYLSSIEHPINVIQSPLVEVSVSEENSHKNLQNVAQNNVQSSVQNHNIQEVINGQQNGSPFEKEPYDLDEPLPKQYAQNNPRNTLYQNFDFNSQRSNQNIYNPPQNNYQTIDPKPSYQHDQNLSENPIIVEDTHVAASSVNSNITLAINQTKRDSAKSLKLPETYTTQTDVIKQLLQQQGILNNDIVDIQKVSDPRFNPTPFNLQKTIPKPSYAPEMSQKLLPPQPSQGKSTWLNPVETSTKKSKQIQIIVPYVMNKKAIPFQKPSFYQKPVNNKNVYTTLVPVYTPPSSTEQSVWSKFVDNFSWSSNKATAFQKPVTPVYNIQDLIDENNMKNNNDLPYDIISLQNNIDHWTQQEYSNKVNNFESAESTNKESVIKTVLKQSNGESRKIPNDYLKTKHSFGKTLPLKTLLKQAEIKKESVLKKPIKKESTLKNLLLEKDLDVRKMLTDYLEHHKESPLKSLLKQTDMEIKNTLKNYIDSHKNIQNQTLSSESTIKNLLKSLETNLVQPKVESTTKTPEIWDTTKITTSPLTKEKIYVVTPQTYRLESTTPTTAWSMKPKVENGVVNNDTNLSFITSKFSVRVEAQNKTGLEVLNKDETQSLKVVYSEWPHIINNLQTTTTKKPTSSHPLFGLMDFSAYTPPPNSTVQTITGHSKVATVVTPYSTTKRTFISTSTENFTKV